ncbi:MAG TPA: exo-alpha-sialidase [Candidatus Polarisedimenticolia bacterium]|nr:exo-alpha-sialidase [Candidatus Polarisedimenticolia bacterium]
MATKSMLLVGTRKGAFILESDAARKSWTVSEPLCEGWPIHDISVDQRTGALLAGGGSPWYGPAVWRSEDLGKTWTHSSEGLTYGDDGPKIPTIWNVTAANGSIYAGVEPAGLFRSEDDGKTWSHVGALRDHPSRPEWQPGAGGLILHTISPHATDKNRMWVGISAVGVFETRDGGATWTTRNKGVRADFNPENIYPEFGQCVHKMYAAAGEPETLYQQNHCGVYRSDNGGESWNEITPGLPSQFGFPAVGHPRDADTMWIIPMNGDDRGRFMPDAAAAVWRTNDRGASWTRLAKGLPQQDAYITVLREAMAVDRHDNVGVYFGTEGGEVWASPDGGESWQEIAAHLPAVWSVEAHVVDA